jgi:hypothetical protein
LTSARNLRSSADSCEVVPGRRPKSISACRTHLCVSDRCT